MWFKRKTKEEKIQKLNNQVKELQEKWADEINSYCKIDNYIFILKGFKLDSENDICIQFIDKDTPDGYINYVKYWKFALKHEQKDFSIARYQFVKFKDELKKVGLKLEKL